MEQTQFVDNAIVNGVQYWHGKDGVIVTLQNGDMVKLKSQWWFNAGLNCERLRIQRVVQGGVKEVGEQRKKDAHWTSEISSYKDRDTQADQRF